MICLCKIFHQWYSTCLLWAFYKPGLGLWLLLERHGQFGRRVHFARRCFNISSREPRPRPLSDGFKRYLGTHYYCWFLFGKSIMDLFETTASVWARAKALSTWLKPSKENALFLNNWKSPSKHRPKLWFQLGPVLQTPGQIYKAVNNRNWLRAEGNVCHVLHLFGSPCQVHISLHPTI